MADMLLTNTEKYSEIMKEWLIFKKVTFGVLCVYITTLCHPPTMKDSVAKFFARFAGSSLAE
jgi:hypothetical protein